MEVAYVTLIVSCLVVLIGQIMVHKEIDEAKRDMDNIRMILAQLMVICEKTVTEEEE